MTEKDVAHVPVLVAPVMALLAPADGEVVADVTVGQGGHAALMAERIGVGGHLIGVDVDAGSLEAAERRLSGPLPYGSAPLRSRLGHNRGSGAKSSCRVSLVRGNFSALDMALAEVGVERVDVLLADLGISSAQLDDPLRGLSFQQDGPLDMRLDDRLEETAEDIVNRMRERELADLIFYNSQERFSRRIAKRICYVRKGGRIKRTGELMEIVCAAIGAQPDSRKSKIHPATRVFQALRIAVNREMEHLETLLSKAPAVLRPGGRIGVISFHSLEDGMVKRDFRARKAEGVYEILTKRPVIAEEEERDRNPRSRSAKLRVARRL